MGIIVGNIFQWLMSKVVDQGIVSRIAHDLSESPSNSIYGLILISCHGSPETIISRFFIYFYPPSYFNIVKFSYFCQAQNDRVFNFEPRHIRLYRIPDRNSIVACTPQSTK